MQNTGKSELLVVMPSDSRVMEDVKMYLRTRPDMCSQTSDCPALQDSTRRILHDKGRKTVSGMLKFSNVCNA